MGVVLQCKAFIESDYLRLDSNRLKSLTSSWIKGQISPTTTTHGLVSVQYSMWLMKWMLLDSTTSTTVLKMILWIWTYGKGNEQPF